MRRAFTLIELLVVIAIISILAAILFPVFAQAKEAAKKTTCLSNIKQIATATILYEADYDDLLPGAVFAPEGDGLEGGWMYYDNFSAADGKITTQFHPEKGSLYPYVKSKDVFKCPSDDIGRRTGNSYSINACTQNSVQTGVSSGKSSTALDNSSQFVLFAEEVFDDGSYNGSASFLSTSSTPDGFLVFPVKYLSTRHTNGSNLAFLDSHAKWTRPEQAFAQSLFQGGDPELTCLTP